MHTQPLEHNQDEVKLNRKNEVYSDVERLCKNTRYPLGYDFSHVQRKKKKVSQEENPRYLERTKLVSNFPVGNRYVMDAIGRQRTLKLNVQGTPSTYQVLMNRGNCGSFRIVQY